MTNVVNKISIECDGRCDISMKVLQKKTADLFSKR